MNPSDRIDFSDLVHGLDALEEESHDAERCAVIASRLLAEVADLSDDLAGVDEFRNAVCAVLYEGPEQIKAAWRAGLVMAAASSGWSAAQAAVKEAPRIQGRKGGIVGKLTPEVEAKFKARYSELAATQTPKAVRLTMVQEFGISESTFYRWVAKLKN